MFEKVIAGMGLFPEPTGWPDKPPPAVEKFHVSVEPARFDVILTGAVGEPSQRVCCRGALVICGVGYTVTTMVSLTPAQAFPTVGVMIISPTMALSELLIGAFQATKFPCPEDGIPIFVLELVHVKEAPAGIL